MSAPTAYVSLAVVPLTLKQANDLVASLHRHHKPARGHRFSVGAIDDGGRLRGAAIIGRPVARNTNQYRVAEVTRLVTDGTPNACSMLYAAAARSAAGMGFERIQTYILASEPGTSLRASGWVDEGPTGGGSWGWAGRPREDSHPTEVKHRWVKQLNPARPEVAA